MALGLSPSPTGAVQVRMYNVGFGDCFLVSVPYDDGPTRHVLVDCGSSTLKADEMQEVVNQLALDCGGKLTAVVVTHRHRDHLSAFGLAGPGAALERLKPDLVLRPWTEDPKAADDATHAAAGDDGPHALRGFLKSLTGMQNLAAGLLARSQKQPDWLGDAFDGRQLGALRAAAELAVPNQKAIDRLDAMAPDQDYVHAFAGTKLSQYLPGVDVTVLGPPDLRQTQTIRQQTRWDDEEFWKLHSAAAGLPNAEAVSAVVPGLVGEIDDAVRAPSQTRWVMERVDELQATSLMGLVRILDRAMNNTSVILLLVVGRNKLLFPGDAQLENWQYALSQPSTAALLSGVDVFKVGHHGSTNALPRETLWPLLTGPQPETSPVALLSTLTGEHEGVPRSGLVEALRKQMRLRQTDKWPTSEPVVNVSFGADGGLLQ